MGGQGGQLPTQYLVASYAPMCVRGFFNPTSVETLKQLCSDFILSLQTHLSPTSAADIES